MPDSDTRLSTAASTSRAHDFSISGHAEAGPAIIKCKSVEPCCVVIFGAAGDLAHRKLFPALFHLDRNGSLPRSLAIVGLSRRDWTSEDLRKTLLEALEEHEGEHPDPGDWERFASRIHHVQGSFEDEGTYQGLGPLLERLDREEGTAGNRLFYLATPPLSFAPIVMHLSGAGLVQRAQADRSRPWQRVVVEKPFGWDLPSALELNKLLSSALHESQIFRIDHYLGKETVQNILVFRLGNTIFEPLWNRNHIANVQITAAESIGIESRGRTYEKTGVLRDIVQNHLLQVLALCAMEPPVTFQADDIRDQKVNVFRSLRPMFGPTLRHDVVWGQYEGYRKEPNVASDSRTPTYVALKLFIDNWRWQGVPFYLRTGKRLETRLTEVAIQFHSIPFCLFGPEEVCARIEPNVLTLRIQPNEGIALHIASKVPGDDLVVGNVRMDFTYEEAFERGPAEAYQRLLLDALRGDATLYTRRDGAEEAWKFTMPILEHFERSAPEVHPYAQGSSGPSAAGELIQRDGFRWRSLTT